jgi:hypothetical protein
MGRNNLENRSKDKNWGFNLTKQKRFKFEILNEQQCRNFELAQGLEMFKLTFAIKLNCKYDISNNDKLDIKGKQYLVLTLSETFDNPIQGQYKGTLDEFTGYTIVGLE